MSWLNIEVLYHLYRVYSEASNAIVLVGMRYDITLKEAVNSDEMRQRSTEAKMETFGVGHDNIGLAVRWVLF
jgi:hypothetical protein